MAVDEFYVVSTTLNPGVQYNVTRAEMELLAELGILIGEPVAPAEVLDSQLADLINDINSLVHAAVEQFPPGPHTHLAVDISDSGSVGRALLAATAALGARATIGLDQVDNTSDAAKPVSTAQQAALNLKAPLASPAFTGTPTGITKAHVGLGSVDNTSDASKPVSTAQAVADTAAKARANHTGTQAAATISDLTETVQDIVAALIVAGTNVTTTYDDVANTFTINSSGGGGGTTDPEIVRDTIGGALVAGAGVTITVNDAGDTITIASTAVLPTRQVVSGTGLSGGGDLSVDRTLAVTYGTTSGTAAQGNDSRIVNAVQTGDARVTADQAAGTASIRTIGTGAQQAKAGNYTPPIADLPAGSTLYVDQNDPAGTWPNRPTSRTDIKVIWTKTVVGSSDPAAATSPAVNGAYSKDLVVGV
ncbi:hypothetical protein [Blastococcus sp. CT_GayMR16]|uniref:hypothetical protein n=1 Tax=Blastococcus sp. CT_GayMR16 TaxID=2559607 RepID=UPI0010740193|nr:hypothetical protein [Blastococcus sp. CT_GayMR16]TFV90394.1 hypothetical protein E4P38_02840 [Blastococcus sp. CT_GayMR16]